MNPFEPDEEHDPLEDFDLEPAEQSVPEVEDPTPETPGLLGPSDVETGLKTLFWKLVLLYKVSLLGLSLGILLVGFGVSYSLGVPLLLGSLAFFAYTLFRTKRGKRRLEAGEFETVDGGESDDVGAEETKRLDGTDPNEGQSTIEE